MPASVRPTNQSSQRKVAIMLRCTPRQDTVFEAFNKDDFDKVLKENHIFFDCPRLLPCLKYSLVPNFNIKVLCESVSNPCPNPRMFKPRASLTRKRTSLNKVLSSESPSPKSKVKVKRTWTLAYTKIIQPTHPPPPP